MINSGLKYALSHAELSPCLKRKVGCYIESQGGYFIATGCNHGTTEACTCNLETGVKNPNVIHAEADAIKNALAQGDDLFGSTFYVTYEPCLTCAELIVQCGAKRVYYLESSDTHYGLVHLIENSIKVTKHA